MNQFTKTLLEIIKEKKMSVSQMAVYLGFKDTTFRDLLRSENTMLRNALKIVDKLNSSLDYFFGLTDTFHCDYKKDYQFDMLERTKYYLKEKNVSYTRLAKELHLSRGNMSRWRLGGAPKVQTIYNFAKFFGVSMDEFVGRI